MPNEKPKSKSQTSDKELQEAELSRDELDAVAGGDGTTEHFFTTEIFEGRVAYDTSGKDGGSTTIKRKN